LVSSGCFEEGERAENDVQFSSAEQEIVECSSGCEAPMYDGSPVACTATLLCASDAGGAYCRNLDGSSTAAVCTKLPGCGNGICESNENQWACPHDCGDPCLANANPLSPC